MASKIILKKSSVAAKVPTTGDLDFGELAINYNDGKLYFKKSDGSIDAFSTTSASGVTSFNGLTGAITATNALDAIKTVDGTGSGLDADLLDGLDSSAFYLASNPNGYTNNTGTVTSVSATAGTGISITGSPITSSGTLIITNTAPNVTTDISITHNTSNVVVNSSDGLDGTINAATTSLAGVMSSADKTKLDGIATGANNYVLPTATSTTLGGIEIFSDVVQPTAANSVTTTALRTYGIQLNSNGQAVVNVPWTGTVTSVSGTGTVSGLSLSGTVTSSGNITLGGTLSVTPSNFASQTANTVLAAPNGVAGTPSFRALVAADIPTLNQNTTGTAANVTGIVAVANGGTGASTASSARTNLGGTTVGQNLFTLTNPSAITFPRINADNTISTLDAATFRTAIGAGTSSTTGTVTSVTGTGTVSGLSLSGTVTSSGNITLGGTLSVTPSNFASQTANTVLAAPNGVAGTPSFRALVAADIPTLNQNTTGTAANVTGTVAIANGGTGATDASTALTNLGAYPASNPSGYITQNDNARLVVKNNSTSVGTRRAINFIQGTGITLSIADDSANEEVDVTINSTATGDVSLNGVQTLTNKRITPRSVEITSSATITPTGDTADQYEVTALAVAATIAAPSGTPTDGQKLIIRIKDNGVARALTWTTTSGAYRAVGVTLPVTTVVSKVVYIGCVYNSQDNFWDVLAVAQLA